MELGQPLVGTKVIRDEKQRCITKITKSAKSFVSPIQPFPPAETATVLPPLRSTHNPRAILRTANVMDKLLQKLGVEITEPEEGTMHLYPFPPFPTPLAPCLLSRRLLTALVIRDVSCLLPDHSKPESWLPRFQGNHFEPHCCRKRPIHHPVSWPSFLRPR
jgi:hypothetical protein